MGLFRTWFRRTRLDQDLDRELRFHVEGHARDLLSAGLSQDEARRRARIDLGGVDQVRERVRESRTGVWLERARSEWRDAWRGLTRTPATALTAAALVAAVIGGNTTLFSMIHGILTKPARGVLATRLVTFEPRVAGRVDFGHS